MFPTKKAGNPLDQVIKAVENHPTKMRPTVKATPRGGALYNNISGTYDKTNNCMSTETNQLAGRHLKN